MAKKRRQHSAQFKFEVVMVMLRGEQTVAEICRQYDLTESLAYKWRDQFLEQAPDIFKDHRHKDQAAADQSARIAELERLVGRLTLEKAILEKAGDWVKNSTGETGGDCGVSERLSGGAVVCGIAVCAQHGVLSQSALR